MNAYVYDGDFLCEDCARKFIEEIGPNTEKTTDSNEYPQGPTPDGGGESDCPQHCDDCGVFLENPLTADGYEYVYEAAVEKVTETIQEWLDYYRIDSTEYQGDDDPCDSDLHDEVYDDIVDPEEDFDFDDDSFDFDDNSFDVEECYDPDDWDYFST